MNFEEHLVSVSVLNRTNECRRLLNGFEIKDIRFLVADSKKVLTDEYSGICNYWCHLISDIFLTKTFQEDVVKKKRKRPKYMFFVDFVNKGLDLIKISSILHDQDVIDSLSSSSSKLSV